MKEKNNLCKSAHLFLIIATYCFLYLPIIVLLVFSFNSTAFPSSWTSFSLHWYRELFTSSHLWTSFYNSCIVATCSTTLSLLLSSSLIFYAAQGGKIRKYLSLYYGNVVIPETILAVALLGFFTIASIPLGLHTLIVAHTVLGLGFSIPILYARYYEIDKRMIEASLVLGATSVQTFFKVILPLLRPSLVATGMLVFIISFDDFILAYFCTGSSAQTLSLYIMSMLRTGVSPVVNALSAILLLFSGVFALIFFSLKSRAKIF